MELTQLTKPTEPAQTPVNTDDCSLHFKGVWQHGDQQKLVDFLDVYFEQTADWSNSVRDMDLQYEEHPYPRLMVSGDFYMEAGLRIHHFALTEDGKPVLVTADDDDCLLAQVLF